MSASLEVIEGDITRLDVNAIVNAIVNAAHEGLVTAFPDENRARIAGDVGALLKSLVTKGLVERRQA